MIFWIFEAFTFYIANKIFERKTCENKSLRELPLFNLQFLFVSSPVSKRYQRMSVVYRARIALLTPMLNHCSLLNCVDSRDAALTCTPVSIDNEEFHFICIPIWPQDIIGVFLSLGIVFICKQCIYHYVMFNN